VVTEVGLVLEGTAAVGAPKVDIAIVFLELRVGLEWLWESAGLIQRDAHGEGKMGCMRGRKVLLTFMQPEARQAWWPGLCK